jgi:hypothetical protein
MKGKSGIALLLEAEPKKGGSGKTGPLSSKGGLAKDIISAVKSGDTDGLALALEQFIAECGDEDEEMSSPFGDEDDEEDEE